MNRNSQDTEVQQQQELTLNDIMATLTRMTSSIEDIRCQEKDEKAGHNTAKSRQPCD